MRLSSGAFTVCVAIISNLCLINVYGDGVELKQYEGGKFKFRNDENKRDEMRILGEVPGLKNWCVVESSQEDTNRLTKLALNPKWYYYMARVIDSKEAPYIADLTRRLEDADICAHSMTRTGRLEDGATKGSKTEPTLDKVTLMILEVFVLQLKGNSFRIWKRNPEEIEQISKIIKQMKTDGKRRVRTV